MTFDPADANAVFDEWDPKGSGPSLASSRLPFSSSHHHLLFLTISSVSPSPLSHMPHPTLPFLCFAAGSLPIHELHELLAHASDATPPETFLPRPPSFMHMATVPNTEHQTPGADSRTAKRAGSPKRVGSPARAPDPVGAGIPRKHEAEQERLLKALASQRHHALQLFRFWDTNGDQKISLDEFRKAIPLTLGKDARKAERKDIDALFALLDNDNEGNVSFSELEKTLAWVHGQRKEKLLNHFQFDSTPGSKSVQEQLREVLVGTGARVTDLFNAWDYNGNGSISRREFKQALTLLGMGQSTEEEMHAIFDTFDLDGSGVISMRELQKHLRHVT